MKNSVDRRTNEKLRRNTVYYVCGIAMSIFLVLAGLDLGVSHFVPDLNQASWLQPIRPILLLETLAVEAFGFAWFVKGETFGILKDKDPKAILVAENVQNNATRKVALSLGVLAGVFGVIHGAFELFQGNRIPNGIYIFANGSPCQPNSAWHSCIPAITFIPYYYWVTGVLAIIVSCIIIFWALFVFVQRKNGGWVLIPLSFIQLFVGGGYISPVFCFIAGLVGLMIQAPFTWWSANPPFLKRDYLAKLWPWFWIITVLVMFFAAYVISGLFFNGFILWQFLLTIVITLVFLLVAVMSTFAYDIQQRQTNTQQAASEAVGLT